MSKEDSVSFEEGFQRFPAEASAPWIDEVKRFVQIVKVLAD